MKTRANSASSLKTLQMCEYKYMLSYEDKKPRIEDHDDAPAFGTCIHHALEHLYDMHMARFGTNQKFSDADYKFIYDKFMEKAAETKVINLNLLQEGKSILQARMNAFDYSEKVLATEKEFSLSTKKGAQFMGYIDKIIEISDTAIAVVDYKTSQMAITQEDADVDVQLSMYDLAASILWPKYKTIILVLDYIRLNPVMTHRTLEQRKLFEDFLDNTNEYIKNKAKESVTPTLNSLCGWCSFKAMCPEFKKAVSEIPAALSAIDKISNDELIHKWKMARGVAKAVEIETRTLKNRIEYLMNKTDADVCGTSERISTAQYTRVNYDIQELSSVVPKNDILRLCYANKNAVEKYIAEHADKADAIRAAASLSYTSPTFRTAKIKDE